MVGLHVPNTQLQLGANLVSSILPHCPDYFETYRSHMLSSTNMHVCLNLYNAIVDGVFPSFFSPLATYLLKKLSYLPCKNSQQSGFC